MSGLRYAGQALFFVGFALLIAVFSATPRYARVPPENALIKLSFSYGAAKKGECRRLSAEEMAQLAPNMRRPTICPRERLPVHIEMLLDGDVVYAESLPPTGLSGDGPSRAYQRFVVSPGEHHLTLRLRDTDRAEGFDHVSDRKVTLVAGQNLAIDFLPVEGAFRFE